MVAKPSLYSAIALAGLSLGGCAYGEVRQVIRAQFATEVSCPEVQIKHRDVWYSYESPDQYKVSGCGVVRTYTCPAGDGMASYDEPACTWVNGDADAPTAAKMPGEADEDMPSSEPADEPKDADEELDDAASTSGGDAAEPDAEGSNKPGAKDSKIKVGGGLKLGGGNTK